MPKTTLLNTDQNPIKKKKKPKQINTAPIRQHWNAFNGKMVLNCDKPPGVPKAFLGFLLKKKKKCSQS